MRRTVIAAVIPAIAGAVFARDQALPNKADSVKFAVIGDFGNGEPAEYELAAQMAAARATFPFDTVITTGDNLLGEQEPHDFVAKIDRPFAPLLNAGVTFYAALGNHDHPATLRYPPLNMAGRRYYTATRKNVRFLMLDSNRPDPEQLRWIAAVLREPWTGWTIAAFHHALYSNARSHGSQVDLRVLFEPLFIDHGVDVVFSGHDHVYERLRPQRGIYYFVEGASGQLRRDDVRPGESTAASFDRDQSFMLVEVSGDDLFFQTIARTGATVDSGAIRRTQAR